MPTTTTPTEKKLLGSMSRRAIARKAGLEPSQISRALTGERSISLDAAAAWAKVRGLTLDEFYRTLRRVGKVAAAAVTMALLSAWMAAPVTVSADQVCAIPLSACSGGGAAGVAFDGGDVTGQTNICGPDNATNVEIGSCTNDANAGTGGISVVIGNAATNSGNASGNIAIGTGSTISSTGQNNVAIGNGAQVTVAGVASAIAIGTTARSSAVNAIAIGNTTVSAFTAAIGLGAQADPTAANQLVIGGLVGNSNHINTVIVGGGVTSTAAPNVTVRASGGSGSNNAGGALTIAPGIGTGTAVGGQVVINRNLRTTTGSAAQTQAPTLVSCPSKILSNTTATLQAIATITTTTDTGGAAWIDFTVVAQSATAVNVDTVMATALWRNISGTATTGLTGGADAGNLDSSGTLTLTATATVATNVVTINVTPAWVTIVPTLVTGYFTFRVAGVNSVVCQ